MCYLAASGLAHQALVCSNILLGLEGIIKIGKSSFFRIGYSSPVAAGLEHCVDCLTQQSEATSIAAIPSITMQLMQKSDKADGAIGVDDLKRWPMESAAVSFLGASAAAVSTEALKQVSYSARAQNLLIPDSIP
jgi:hypothetical protein